MLFWVASMKKRKATWIVLLIVSLSLLGGSDWLASMKAAGFFVLEQEKGSHRPALLAASVDEESPSMSRPTFLRRRKWSIGCWSWLRSRKGDVVYDLGSGDAGSLSLPPPDMASKPSVSKSVPIWSSARGTTSRRPAWSIWSKSARRMFGSVDLSPASVVTLYLYPSANLRLRDMIMRQLKPGSRVISHQFTMGTWKPDRVDQIMDSTGILRTLYLWRIGK